LVVKAREFGVTGKHAECKRKGVEKFVSESGALLIIPIAR
jgi:hypothetical protein